MRAAGPGAAPVADEPQRGHDQDGAEASLFPIIIIEDEDDNEEGGVTEADEPSSRAGPGPAHARVAMVRTRHAAAAASAPRARDVARKEDVLRHSR